jgi:tRNA (guanine10-N2)-dimethyltransferase
MGLALRLLFELSGEHPELPALEAEEVARTAAPGSSRLTLEPGVLVMELPEGKEFPFERLAYAHAVHRHLFSCPVEDVAERLGKIMEEEGALPRVPTARVRVSGFAGLRAAARNQTIEKELGAILHARFKIDLVDPELKLRVLLSDNAHAGIVLWEQEKKPIERRKAAHRPFFSPISLGPKLARAMVNLSGCGGRATVLDPFCGTGGILIEAGSMGLRVVGSDVDWRMVEGCQKNLEHYGTRGKVFKADIGEVAPLLGERMVDAIVTDLPYGRASGTGGEKVAGIYERLFRTAESVLGPGRRMVLAVHEPSLLPKTGGMRLLRQFDYRVHKSLTRHIMVWART